MDWFSRFVLSWELSNTMETSFCLAALQAAFRFGQPEIWNSDQGSQFTSADAFSEWTQVIPNARLCKALLDRITDRAHILETGTESYCFRRTAEKHKKGAKSA